MKKRFTITYDIVTQESSENRDVEHSGFLDENFDYERNGQYRHAEGITHAAFTLREVFEFLTSDYPGEHARESVECDSSPWHLGNPPRWVTFTGGLNDEDESLSFTLHPDKREGITGASMCRIARLFSAYGECKPSAE